jgi:hypothetical protein
LQLISKSLKFLKMKKLKTLLTALTLLPTLLFAQASGQGGVLGSDQNFINPSNGMANIGGTNVPMDKKYYEDVKGTPMICKDFVKGFVVTRDTFNKIDNYAYNYDAYKNELHIRSPDGSVKIPFNNQIRGFQLIDKNVAHNFKKAAVPGISPYQYYEIIAETPQYSLLKRWIKKFVKASPVDRGPVTVGRVYDEFEDDQIYFFRVEDGVYKEIKKLSKSNFVELLPNRKTDIEAYWKANKLSKKITEVEARGFLKALEKAKN